MGCKMDGWWYLNHPKWILYKQKMYRKPYGQSLKAQRYSRSFGFVFSRCKATGETSATVLSPANLFRLLICFENPLTYEQTKLPNFHHWFVGDGDDKPDINQIYLFGGRSLVKLLQQNGTILL